MTSKSVKAFAPATVANVGCAFDIMGFAVDSPGDLVELSWNKSGEVLIESIEGDNGLLPREVNRNTASVAVKAYLEHQKITEGISISLVKDMPLGSGLGSSAASAAAALVAVNRLCNDPLSRAELLPFALKAEAAACGSAHADNVAPALLGGIVLILPFATPRCIELPVPEELYCCVVCPDLEIRTADARKILREQVAFKTSVRQSGNVAGLVASLYLNDASLLGECIEDFIVEPQRKKLIPGFDSAKQAALAAGALGCSISGSGPSLFALAHSKTCANDSAQAIAGVFAQQGISSKSFVSHVNKVGAAIVD
jgi:homoserine kinase